MSTFCKSLTQRLRAFPVLAAHRIGWSVMTDLFNVCHFVEQHCMPTLRPFHAHHDGSPLSLLHLPACIPPPALHTHRDGSPHSSSHFPGIPHIFLTLLAFSLHSPHSLCIHPLCIHFSAYRLVPLTTRLASTSVLSPFSTSWCQGHIRSPLVSSS